MMNINISKLERAERCGDWHDKPLRWAVSGPAGELQKFSTLRDAKQYKSIRRRAASAQEAHRAFAATV